MKVISFAIKKWSILEEANKNITKYVKNYSQGINKVPIKNKLKTHWDLNLNGIALKWP